MFPTAIVMYKAKLRRKHPSSKCAVARKSCVPFKNEDSWCGELHEDILFPIILCVQARVINIIRHVHVLTKMHLW